MRRLRMIAVLSALFWSMLGFGLAAPAHAAGSTLTLIKSEGEGDTPGQPLEGIRFQLNRLEDVDATSPEQVAELVAADPEVLTSDSHYAKGPDVIVTTDASGHASSDVLPDGVYLVQELPSREGNIGWSVATPFLVALPAADGARDVQVQVKNQPEAIEIAVGSKQVCADDDFTVSLAGSVPAPDRKGRLHNYALVTEHDPAMLDAAAADVWVESLDGRVDLVEGVHYRWRHGSIIMELTDKGLAELARTRSGHPETRVHMTYTGRIDPATPEGTRMGFDGHLFTDGRAVPRDRAEYASSSAATMSDSATYACPTTPLPAPPDEGRGEGRGLASTGAETSPWVIGGAVLASIMGAMLLGLARQRHNPNDQESCG